MLHLSIGEALIACNVKCENFISVVISAMLYGSETWCLRENEMAI